MVSIELITILAVALDKSANEQPFKTNSNWELRKTESCFVHVTFL